MSESATAGGSSAKDLITKIATDSAFRESLTNAQTVAEKRAIIVQAGFGNVRPEDIPAAALPAAATVEDLSDEQLTSVASAANDTVTTATTTTTVFAGASAAVAAA